ncbi:hypothetical protein V8G54_015530 [Vigna mungo]|uniref:Uncharacterized protein n=1 Tax=Vigna mungo TaxID=3915 RepID=A0AAQ3NJL6_VIGMU
MSMALQMKNKIDFVYGSIPCPTDKDILFYAWKRCNNMPRWSSTTKPSNQAFSKSSHALSTKCAFSRELCGVAAALILRVTTVMSSSVNSLSPSSSSANHTSSYYRPLSSTKYMVKLVVAGGVESARREEGTDNGEDLEPAVECDDGVREEISDRLQFFVEEYDHIKVTNFHFSNLVVEYVGYFSFIALAVVGFQFIVDDSRGFSTVAAEFLENIVDKYTNILDLLYDVHEWKHTVLEVLHDSISFSRLSSYYKLVALYFANLNGWIPLKALNDLFLLEILQPLTPQTDDDVEDMLAIEHMTVHGALASGIDYKDLSTNIFFMTVQDVAGLILEVSFLQMQDKAAYDRFMTTTLEKPQAIILTESHGNKHKDKTLQDNGLPLKLLGNGPNRNTETCDFCEMNNHRVIEDRLILLKGVRNAFRPGVLTTLIREGKLEGILKAGSEFHGILKGKKRMLESLATMSRSISTLLMLHSMNPCSTQRNFVYLLKSILKPERWHIKSNKTHWQLPILTELIINLELVIFTAESCEGLQMFIEEVMELVELNLLREALIGLPGMNNARD